MTFETGTSNTGFVWRAPKGASFGDGRNEPGASTRLKLMVRLLGPFAPDEML